MFDLNTAVAAWRRDLDRTTKLPRTALDELEDHLLGDIDIQMEYGVAPERAYLEAIERLGHPKALQREFEKNSQGRRWLFAGGRLGLIGYIVHNIAFATHHFWFGLLELFGSKPKVELSDNALVAAGQALSMVFDNIALGMMAAGEVLLMLPIAILGLILTLKRRQKGWSVTFILTLLAMPLMLTNLGEGVYSLWSLFVLAVLIVSLFTVYPPSLPSPLEQRLRRA
ncbi:MAG: hypothetical protein AAGJ10_15405 [Bacteroidota bacterium]